MNLKRDIKQWENCNPYAMVNEQSDAAKLYAFQDARHDLLMMHRLCSEAASEITLFADELKSSSTVAGEWDGTEDAAKDEYDRLMNLASRLST